MAETSKLEIVTLEAIVYSEDVEMVTLTERGGRVGDSSPARRANDSIGTGRNDCAQRRSR